MLWPCLFAYFENFSVWVRKCYRVFSLVIWGWVFLTNLLKWDEVSKYSIEGSLSFFSTSISSRFELFPKEGVFIALAGLFLSSYWGSIWGVSLAFGVVLLLFLLWGPRSEPCDELRETFSSLELALFFGLVLIFFFPSSETLVVNTSFIITLRSSRRLVSGRRSITSPLIGLIASSGGGGKSESYRKWLESWPKFSFADLAMKLKMARNECTGESLSSIFPRRSPIIR